MHRKSRRLRDPADGPAVVVEEHLDSVGQVSDKRADFDEQNDDQDQKDVECEVGVQPDQHLGDHHNREKMRRVVEVGRVLRALQACREDDQEGEKGDSNQDATVCVDTDE